jgi:hypothetical protein
VTLSINLAKILRVHLFKPSRFEAFKSLFSWYKSASNIRFPLKDGGNGRTDNIQIVYSLFLFIVTKFL